MRPFSAVNLSKEPILGTATFNVAPFDSAAIRRPFECLLLALMRPSPTAGERPVLARNRTSQGFYRCSFMSSRPRCNRPPIKEKAQLSANFDRERSKEKA